MENQMTQVNWHEYNKLRNAEGVNCNKRMALIADKAVNFWALKDARMIDASRPVMMRMVSFCPHRFCSPL